MVQALVLAAASCEISVAVVGIDNRACAVPVTSWDSLNTLARNLDAYPINKEKGTVARLR